MQAALLSFTATYYHFVVSGHPNLAGRFFLVENLVYQTRLFLANLSKWQRCDIALNVYPFYSGFKLQNLF